jgi:hypothetical protein
MHASPQRQVEHVLRRQTPFGQWMPPILYSLNVGAAMAAAIAVGAADLLYLALFPLPALIAYVWSMSKGQP